jgi:maltose alpha-D-glucosyltransferase / alpha-amylase
VDLTRDRDDTVDHDPAEGSHVEAGVVEHPSADEFAEAKALPADPTWFKRAVFYEVLVRAFYDGNADGATCAG